MSDVERIAAGRTCYRHPNRPAPLACSRCGRPICIEDAIDAPVGFLCPEDAQVSPAQRQATRSVRRMDRPPATIGFLGAIGGAYLLQMVVGGIVVRYGLFGPAVAAGQLERLVTSGFLHGGLLHLGFNGYLAWMLGRMLEPAMPSHRFAGIWVAGLLGGSAGALLLSYNALTIGASGAVFGLMGAAMVGMRSRGVNPWSTQLGSLLALNLVLTFVIGNISVGGHLGGLAAGTAAGWVAFRFEETARADLVWLVAVAAGALALGIGVTGATLGLGI